MISPCKCALGLPSISAIKHLTWFNFSPQSVPTSFALPFPASSDDRCWAGEAGKRYLTSGRTARNWKNGETTPPWRRSTTQAPSHATKSSRVLAHGLNALQGLLPMTFHVDGAEFYSNSEYVVWSMSSALASGDAAWFVVEHSLLRVAEPDKNTPAPLMH